MDSSFKFLYKFVFIYSKNSFLQVFFLQLQEAEIFVGAVDSTQKDRYERGDPNLDILLNRSQWKRQLLPNRENN